MTPADETNFTASSTLRIILTEEDRAGLEQFIQTGTEAEAQRAHIMLLSAAGATAAQISQELGVTDGRVRYWRRRFRAGGLPALRGIISPPSPVSAVKKAGKRKPEPAADTAPALSAKKAKKKQKSAQKRAKLAKTRLTQAAASEPAPTEAPSTDAPLNETSHPEAFHRETLPEALPVGPLPAGALPPGTLPVIILPAGGLALVTPRPNLGLQPQDTLAEAGKKVCSFFLARMLENEPGTRLGEDIEALHDMRVATRRMRAAFDIFGTAFKPDNAKVHLKGLRSTGRALGAVRDWDVFLEKAEQDIHHLPPADQANLESLLERWRNERDASRTAMLTYLDSDAYRLFVTRFNRFVQTPGMHEMKIKDAEFDGEPVPVVRSLAHLAPVLIYTRLGAVRAFSSIIPHAKIIQLHALRIEFKRLHYLLDFMKEILGPEGKAVLGAVKRMQDHLGDLNDSDVACLRLSEVLDNWEFSQINTPLAQRQTPSSLLAYLSLKHSQRHDLLIRFPAAWEAFDTVDLRRQLAAALAVL